MDIAYVNVFVTDLDRSCEFYRQTLGLALEQADPDGNLFYLDEVSAAHG